MATATSLKAFVLGASGTAGKSIVKALIDHPKFETVTLIGRRNLELANIANHQGFSKIDQKIIDFEDVEKYAHVFQGFDVGFCALGTSSVGLSKEQYYHVTYDYVVNTAQLARSGGCKYFHFISGQRTSKDSSFAWARTKAKVEEKLSLMGFERLWLYRPAGIIKDKSEIKTTGESIGICAWKVLDPFHWNSVETTVLGKVMVNNTFQDSQSVQIFENGDILRLGKAV